MCVFMKSQKTNAKMFCQGVDIKIGNVLRFLP